MKAIHDEVNVKAKVVVNITVSEKAKEEASNVIKGPYSRRSEHYRYCFRPRGSVGKKHSYCKFGHRIEEDGIQVGLIDADIYGPSAPLMI